MQIAEIETLVNDIQKAFDRKDLDAISQFYHPDITYIGPAFPAPIVGLEGLKKAFGHHFQGPQRTRTSIKEINVRHLSDDSFVVHCLVEGVRIVYFSEESFRGRLTRVFVGPKDRPRIVHEHFSLTQ